MIINKDTNLCISISAFPSNLGSILHNYAYELLQINYIYKSFSISNLNNAIVGVRALGIKGCSVSMPFKIKAMKFMDEIDPIAFQIGAINSIVNNGVSLKGYNTDFYGALSALKKLKINKDTNILLLGSGGMAKAFLAALREFGCRNIDVIFYKKNNLAKVKEYFNFNTSKWVTRNSFSSDIIINATPLGMSHLGDYLMIDEEIISRSKGVIDSVVKSEDTKLIRVAKQNKIPYVKGIDIALEQMINQFKLYTGNNAPRKELKKKMMQIKL